MEEILKNLVAFPTISKDQATNKAAIEWIDAFLSKRGMHTKRYNFEGFESVVATTRKTKTPKVLLAAHIDVVHGHEDQFTLTKKGGRYYGRGAADMKFAIAVFLQLVDDLKDSLGKYDFGVMVTSDEEIGGYWGVNQLIREGYKPDVVILPDAGDTPDNWKLERSAKGRLSIKIQAKGTTAHAGRPWLGDNAITKLTPMLNDVLKDFTHQDADTNTCTLSMIEGGEAFNQVPAHATADLDIRTLSDEDSYDILQRLQALAKKHDAVVVNDNAAHCVASRTDLKNPFTKDFINLVEQTTGKPIDIVNSTAGSDARYFFAANIPYIVASPPAGGYHAAHEWVSAEGMEQFLSILKTYLKKHAL